MKTKILSILLGILLVFNIAVEANSTNDTIKHSTISVDNGCIYAIYGDGTLYRFEYINNAVVKTKIMENVTDVSRNYAIKEDGTLWTWDSEKCIAELIAEDVISVNSGGIDNSALFIMSDGSLWKIDKNYGGQYYKGYINKYINNSSNRYYDEPKKIMDNVLKAEQGAYHSIILKNDGSVWGLGDNSYGQCGNGFYSGIYGYTEPHQIMTGAKNIFASGAASFAIQKEDDTLYAWGSNYADHIGDSTGIGNPARYADNVKSIVNLPGYNLIVKNDSSLWLYGDINGYDKIIIKSPIEISVPVKLYDNINSVDGVDNIDDRFYMLTAALDNNRELYLLKYNDDVSDNGEVFNIKKIARNIRLSNETPLDIGFIDINNIPSEESTAIKSLAKSGIIKGINDTRFAPDKAISRAETAAILLRMTGKGDETAITHFTDVPTDSWYYAIAGAAQKYGIIDGYEDNTFRGEETVSDLQLAVLAARTLKNEGTAMEPDAEQSITVPSNIPDWAADDISYAIKYGILTEEEAGKLSDTNGMTRGEAAVILYRLYCAV